MLRRLINLRNSANPEEDKPFLDHLEDLRGTLTKVIITVILSTVICWSYRGELMQIIQQPAQKVWDGNQEKQLKEIKVNSVDWNKALQYLQRSSHLPAAQRSQFQAVFQEEHPLAFSYAKSIALAQSAQILKDPGGYLKSLELEEEDLKQTTELLPFPADSDLYRLKSLVEMQGLGPTEGFSMSFKLALFAGIIVTFPLLLYFTLQFLLPGLKKKERKALYGALVIGVGLFIAGVLFAYLIVLPRALDFFYTLDTRMGITPDFKIGDYVTFATRFTLMFGLAFELPVIVMTFVKLGLLGYQEMKSSRSYAIVAIFIIAAIITPTPDGFTLCLMAVPMIILYEICIWMSYFIGKKETEERLKQEADDRARMETLLSKATPAVSVSRDDETYFDDDTDLEPQLDDTEEGEEEDVSDPLEE